MAGTGKPPEHYQIEDFVTDESFINYFFHLNAEDVTFWENWLRTNPARQQSVDTAKEMLRSLTLTLPDQEIIDETAKLKQAVGFESPDDLKKEPAVFRLLQFGPASPRFGPAKRRFGSARQRRIILVPVLMILLAAGYWIFRSMNPDLLIEKLNNSNNPIVFSLTDGTTVTLAPRSSLRYAPDFGEKERTVSLDGEAQFNVSRKTDHPFEVQENELKVTVLGTIFNVKKQSGDSIMIVELLKGKLKVENINSTGLPITSILLNPDERVIYNRHDQRLYKESWQPKTGNPVQIDHILFQRNNFDEIAAKMKAAFAITVINQSNKKNWMFSGEFENATAEEIIKNICVVERLKFETTGDTILIK